MMTCIMTESTKVEHNIAAKDPNENQIVTKFTVASSIMIKKTNATNHIQSINSPNQIICYLMYKFNNFEKNIIKTCEKYRYIL